MTAAKQLLEEIQEALVRRNTWDMKQRVWYQMRHEGLRRKNPPYPGAADLHFPLCDGTIDEFKPYYWQQTFQGVNMTEFYPLTEQARATADSCAGYFSYYLQNRTNFTDQILHAIDTMCVRGKGVMRVWWNLQTGKLEFDHVDPQYIIVPELTEDLDKSDWICHVKRLSKRAYLNTEGYNHEDWLVKRLLGGITDQANLEMAKQEKQLREGIAYSGQKDEIIVWEVYEHNADGGWTIRTVSPLIPDTELRAAFNAVIEHDGQTIQPFVDFSFEIKDGGWYAGRGIVEKLAPMEASVCKWWNVKHDAMELMVKPCFTGDPLTNSGNIHLGPGDILPTGLSPVAWPKPPMDIDNEMEFQRMVAQQYIQTPSAQLAQDTTRGAKSGDITATQINYQAQLAGTQGNFRGFLWRTALRKLYVKAWATLVHHQPKDLIYYIANDLKVLPQQALANEYLIEPSGTSEGWNRQKRVQDAYRRLQTFAQNPLANQEELVRQALMSEDSRLVQQILLPSGQLQATQAESQAVENVLMQDGYPAPIKPNDDDVIHMGLLGAKMKDLVSKGQLTPVASPLMVQHFEAHMMALQKKNPAMAKKVQDGLQQMMQGLAGQQAQPGMSPTAPALQAGGMPT